MYHIISVTGNNFMHQVHNFKIAKMHVLLASLHHYSTFAIYYINFIFYNIFYYALMSLCLIASKQFIFKVLLLKALLLKAILLKYILLKYSHIVRFFFISRKFKKNSFESKCKNINI